MLRADLKAYTDKSITSGEMLRREIAEVRRTALRVMDSLVEQGVKLLVIACNTASAACLRDARKIRA